MANELTKRETTEQVISRIDEITAEVPALNTSGFKAAIVIAQRMNELKGLLTPEVMKDIMALQNSTVGFVTDRQAGGYDVDTVKECVIWAIMNGLPVVGNCFNIIAGRGYATKNGMKLKLDNLPGLSYGVTPGIPKMAGDQGAVIKMECEWEVDGRKRTKTIEIPVRVNKGMGCDAIIGKAKRKTYAWLYEQVTGNFIPDAEADDERVIIQTTAKKVSPFETPATEQEKSQPMEFEGFN